MAGRHRAAPQRTLKAPAAAGATVVALGLTVALTSILDTDDPGEASLAAHRGDLDTDNTSPTTSTKTTTKAKPAAASKKPKKVIRKARQTTERQATATIPAKPVASCSTVLDGTQPHVAQVGNHILSKFDVDSVGGRAARGGASDHPSGLAIDFMVDSATGDELADYVLQNQSRFGVTYVIWQQQYNDGSGWSTMEDRGSPTANHMDHVHVSFSGAADIKIAC